MDKCRAIPRVKAVRAYTMKPSPSDQGADCHDVPDEHWIDGYPTPIANPMSGYLQYRQSRYVSDHLIQIGLC